MEKEFGGNGEAREMESIPKGISARLVTWERFIGDPGTFGGLESSEMTVEDSALLSTALHGQVENDIPEYIASIQQELVDIQPNKVDQPQFQLPKDISFFDVAKICEKLRLSKGVTAISNRDVRDVLGRGSLTSINTHVRKWTANHRKTEKLVSEIDSRAAETLSVATKTMIINLLYKEDVSRNKIIGRLEKTITSLKINIDNLIVRLEDAQEKIDRRSAETVLISIDLLNAEERLVFLAAQIKRLEAETGRLANARDAAAAEAAISKLICRNLSGD